MPMPHICQIRGVDFVWGKTALFTSAADYQDLSDDLQQGYRCCSQVAG